MTRRILLVLTSQDRLGDTGRATGFNLAEAAYPWQAFVTAGYRVDLVSPRGGRPPMDEADRSGPAQQAFQADPDIQAKLAATARPVDVDPAEYSAVFFAGGHGTMWDFPDDPALAGVTRAVYEAGGVVAAVCHGPAALVNVTLSDGRYLVDGKQVAAFTDAEEVAVGLTDIVPFSLQTVLEQRGAKHTGAANFTAHVAVDGRLVTGQNPASAEPTAKAVVELLDAASAE